jgi:hypothetical protein
MATHPAAPVSHSPAITADPRRIVNRVRGQVAELGEDHARSAAVNRVELTYTTAIGRWSTANLEAEQVALDDAAAVVLTQRLSSVVRHLAEDEIQWMLDAILDELEGRAHDRRDPSSGVAQ